MRCFLDLLCGLFSALRAVTWQVFCVAVQCVGRGFVYRTCFLDKFVLIPFLLLCLFFLRRTFCCFGSRRAGGGFCCNSLPICTSCARPFQYIYAD